MALALGVREIEEHARALAELLGGAAAPGSLWDKLKMLPKLGARRRRAAEVDRADRRPARRWSKIGDRSI